LRNITSGASCRSCRVAARPMATRSHGRPPRDRDIRLLPMGRLSVRARSKLSGDAMARAAYVGRGEGDSSARLYPWVQRPPRSAKNHIPRSRSGQFSDAPMRDWMHPESLEVITNAGWGATWSSPPAGPGAGTRNYIEFGVQANVSARRSGLLRAKFSARPPSTPGPGLRTRPSLTRAAPAGGTANDPRITPNRPFPGRCQSGMGLRPGRWCNFPGFERRIVDVRSHRGMVSENRSK
jgi:hypothetical protein